MQDRSFSRDQGQHHCKNNPKVINYIAFLLLIINCEIVLNRGAVADIAHFDAKFEINLTQSWCKLLEKCFSN